MPNKDQPALVVTVEDEDAISDWGKPTFADKCAELVASGYVMKFLIPAYEVNGNMILPKMILEYQPDNSIVSEQQRVAQIVARLKKS